jgi:hypothetical protein
MVKKNDKKNEKKTGKKVEKDKIKPPPKKRGRKPKGGKIINNIIDNKIIEVDAKSNIILHLKHLSDTNIKDETEKKTLEYLNLSKKQNSNFNNYQNNVIDNKIDKKETTVSSSSKNVIWEKIKNLRCKFHNNDIDKRSACFWCTYPFDNPPIYIPKNQKNKTIEVYGCFCSPECAVAYLKKEKLDTSVLWERYAMLNNIYSKIYNYTSNIKPAPCPLYTLDKYYGNMTIEEYRKVLNQQYLLIVVDKPLTKVMPELYDDNNDLPTIYNNMLENNTDNQTIRLGRKTNNTVKNLF